MAGGRGHLAVAPEVTSEGPAEGVVGLPPALGKCEGAAPAVLEQGKDCKVVVAGS